MRKLYLLLLFFFTLNQLFSQNYTVLGNASQLPGCKCYQLTPNSGGQAGAIFQNNSINLNNSFDFTFSNFFGCNGASGADGEAFVLTTNPNGLGNQGEGLGYGGSNQPCSFAIEFDTWQNGDHNDPGYDHTAYESGGSVDHNVVGPVPALPSQSNLDNCQWHTIEIVWNVNTQTMSDYVDGVLRISQYLPNLISNYMCGIPTVNWGWTGSTGGGWNLQQVCIKSISNWVAGNNYQSCSPTIPFTDISTTNVSTVQSWNWTFGDGATSTLQNPSHTYADTGIFNATLIIKDVSGCSDTFSHPVHIVAPITLTPAIVNPLCNGAQTGSISLTTSGGLGASAGHGGFTYSWSDGDQGPVDQGIAAGTVTVTVTDGVCTSTAQYTLNQPPVVTATVASTAANCGLSNGSATITISGGTAPYSAGPTPPYGPVTFGGISGTTTGNTTTVTGLSAGTWIADFHDANGCSALLQYTATVANLPCGVSSNATNTNVTCFGGSNGSVTLTVTGGTAPATINWTNAGGTNVGTGVTVNNLPAGTYTYNYTDANTNNAFNGTVTITQPGAAMAIGLSTTDISCAGANNGQAIVSVLSGGAHPFNYTWSPAQPNNPVASGLSTGPISVTVTDSVGCTATATANIASAPPLQLNITTTNNGCNQYNNGSATANVTGGTTPYAYYWNNISNAQTDLSLGGGTYTVTVTDSASCTITGTASISQSPPFVNTIDSTNITCHGDTTGTITVNSTGGAAPYVYSWSSDTIGIIDSSLVGAHLINLKAGEYLLTVTDAHGCTFFDSTFLQQPAAPVSIVVTQKNVSCFGGTAGSITLATSGGTAPYGYAWTGSGSTVDSATALAAGNYSVTITDAKGCALDSNFIITQPTQGLVLTASQTNLSCYNSNDGVARVAVVGGTSPYQYTWSPPAVSAVDSATGLAAGNYGVLVTDNNQCTATQTYVITQPTQITPVPSIVNVSCFGGANGSITFNTTGGAGTYTYIWNPNVSTSGTASNLAAGPYAVTVTDATLCSVVQSVNVTQPALPLSATYVVTNVACFNASTGSIAVTAAGGTPTYAYSWTPAALSGSTASNLSAGNYSVTVTDLNGCTVDSSFIITQPATALALLDSSQTNLTCFGSNDGVARITATGGTIPYTYGWTNSSSTVDSATHLAAGVYTVTVTDSNGCFFNTSYNITQPAQIVTTGTPVNVKCFGQATGEVTITATGGAGGGVYTYTWNPNVSTTDSATNLTAGTYVVTVTDAAGCTTSQSTTVTQPAQLNLTVNTTPTNCFGDSTGTIVVTATGGDSPYNFFASNGGAPHNNTTGQFSAVSAGTYVIVVDDSNGCPDTTSAVVAQPVQLTDVLAFASPSCSYLINGKINVTASGGNPGYTYATTGQTTNSSGLFTGLAAGNYVVSITDTKGCKNTDSATLVKPDSVLVNVSPVTGQVKLGDSLQITTTTNQTGVVSYAWSPDFGLSCYDCADPTFNGVYSQPYTVVITNDSGCVAQVSFDVTVIPNYDFFIPNAFTPNGDGKNDYWQIFGNTSALKQLQVMVFDRIGEKVFESNEIDFKWDGTFKGQPAPVGVYVYAFKLVWLDNRSDDTIAGSITLLR